MLRKTTADRIETLFELYEQKMYRIAFSILNDEGQAEDAVIAAFEKILKTEGIPRDPKSDASDRLTTLAVRSAAIDQYRVNARERQQSVLVDDIASCASGIVQTSTPSIDSFIEKDHLKNVVNDLPEKYGEVITECFLHDRNVRETAEILGISEANVRKRQQRGLSILRDLKGGMGYGAPVL